MSKELILIVDDDIYMYALMKTVLQESYEILYAKDGEACFESLERHQPTLILLDIEMGGISGYDVCREIKGREGDLPSIIFVSAHSTPEDRLKAYAAGADDFVTKPLSPEELYRKVEQTMKSHQEMESLRLSAREAMGVAMTAMSDTGALGAVLQLFRKMFAVTSHDGLARLLLEMVADRGLSGTVQIRTGQERLTLNSEGRSSMMESVLLDSLGAEGKSIVDYGPRTSFNFGPVSLLIKNMPLDDNQEYGNLKDQMALLVEGAAERARGLNAALLSEKVGDIHDVLQSIDQKYKQQQAETLSTVNDMMKELENTLIFLALTDRQENALTQVVSKAMHRITDAYNAGLEIDRYLSDAMVDIAKVRG